MTADIVLALPPRLDIQGALKATALLNDLPEANFYRFDFSKLNFVEPFGMLYFAAQLRNFRRANLHCRFKAENYQQLSYAAHMGFFQAFGLNFGKEPGEAPGNAHYVPITCISLKELEREAASKYEDERETLERISMELATVLVRDNSGPLHETISYSLREIFRNVLEHSGADSIWYAAQYWPATGWVELSILDEGAGIASTLARNPHLQITCDLEALQLALLPGVSGVAFKGGPKQRKDAWANSGYGLFMTSQLCLRGGSFAVMSGHAGLMLQNQEQSQLECTYNGTAIRLQFHVPEIQELSLSLEELRQRGADIAGTLKQNANITASMSSRMLVGKAGQSYEPI